MTLDRLDLLEPGIEIELADEAPDAPALASRGRAAGRAIPSSFRPDRASGREAEASRGLAHQRPPRRWDRRGRRQERERGHGNLAVDSWVRIPIRRIIYVLNYIVVIISEQDILLKNSQPQSVQHACSHAERGNK